MNIVKIPRRDERSFLVAYDAYAPRIFRHVYFRVSSKEIAEDISSQVFLKAWQYLQDHTIESAAGFLYRIAHNLLVDHYRRKTREPVLLDEEFERKHFYENDIVKELEGVEELRRVRRAMNELKKDFRDVLVFRYIDGLSVEEIAQLTKRSKNAVYILLSRATHALKEYVNFHEKHDEGGEN